MGYSAQHDHLEDLHKVSYGGSRLIKASTVAAMLDGDEAARLKVDKAVLAMKAIEWSYGSEWRLVGPCGLRESPLELEEVIFGLRCSLEVKFAVVRALENRRRPVKFYEIRERRGEFPLNKCILDTDELCVSLPRARADEFDALADDE